MYVSVHTCLPQAIAIRHHDTRTHKHSNSRLQTSISARDRDTFEMTRVSNVKYSGRARRERRRASETQASEEGNAVSVQLKSIDGGTRVPNCSVTNRRLVPPLSQHMPQQLSNTCNQNAQPARGCASPYVRDAQGRSVLRQRRACTRISGLNGRSSTKSG